MGYPRTRGVGPGMLTGYSARTRLIPSLRFKRVHAALPIYSARVGIGYRALAIVDGDTAIWFWVGTHAEYDRLQEKL